MDAWSTIGRHQRGGGDVVPSATPPCQHLSHGASQSPRVSTHGGACSSLGSNPDGDSLRNLFSSLLVQSAAGVAGVEVRMKTGNRRILLFALNPSSIEGMAIAVLRAECRCAALRLVRARWAAMGGRCRRRRCSEDAAESQSRRKRGTKKRSRCRAMYCRSSCRLHSAN